MTDKFRTIAQIAEYQVIVDGNPVSILDLSKSQLLAELMSTMDLLEELEELTEKLNSINARYRS